MALAYPDTLKWFSKPPSDPGFYWLAEDGMQPHMVQLDFVVDTSDKLEVLLPGDERKYSIDIWSKALWCGPLKSPQ